MPHLTEAEKACQFFDGCHKSSAHPNDIFYYIGVLLCNQSSLLETIAGAGSTEHVLQSSAETDDGTVPAGASSVTFLPSNDFTGTIDGISYPGSDWQTIPFQAASGKTLPAIAYTVTAGTLNIIILS